MGHNLAAPRGEELPAHPGIVGGKAVMKCGFQVRPRDHEAVTGEKLTAEEIIASDSATAKASLSAYATVSRALGRRGWLTLRSLFWAAVCQCRCAYTYSRWDAIFSDVIETRLGPARRRQRRGAAWLWPTHNA